MKKIMKLIILTLLLLTTVACQKTNENGEVLSATQVIEKVNSAKLASSMTKNSIIKVEQIENGEATTSICKQEYQYSGNNEQDDFSFYSQISISNSEFLEQNTVAKMSYLDGVTYVDMQIGSQNSVKTKMLDGDIIASDIVSVDIINSEDDKVALTMDNDNYVITTTLSKDTALWRSYDILYNDLASFDDYEVIGSVVYVINKDFQIINSEAKYEVSSMIDGHDDKITIIETESISDLNNTVVPTIENVDDYILESY